MRAQVPFGFVTGCHAGDKFMVHATLASMRHFCPQVPICLIADGNFDVSDLERDYGVLTLRIPDLPSPEMRSFIGGNPRAKLAAFWEGPFEFFVWMDSDAIVWGDFTRQIRTDVDFQIFWSEISVPPGATEVPDWLSHYYFDPGKLRKFDPEFQWQGLAYFCNGTFAARRNAFTLEEWMQAFSWGKESNGPWPKGFYDMPMMNYLVHAKSQRGSLKVVMTDLQHIWTHHGIQELDQDCQGNGWQFPAKVNRPRVAHFCGRKPLLFDFRAYSRPFTIARLAHYRRHKGALVAWLSVLNEDRRIMAKKLARRLKFSITK